MPSPTSRPVGFRRPELMGGDYHRLEDSADAQFDDAIEDDQVYIARRLPGMDVEIQEIPTVRSSMKQKPLSTDFWPQPPTEPWLLVQGKDTPSYDDTPFTHNKTGTAAKEVAVQADLFRHAQEKNRNTNQSKKDFTRARKNAIKYSHDIALSKSANSNELGAPATNAAVSPHNTMLANGGLEQQSPELKLDASAVFSPDQIQDLSSHDIIFCPGSKESFPNAG